MKRQEFCQELGKALQVKQSKLTEQTDLRGLKELDSLGMLDLIAFIDKSFDMQISAQRLKEASTVKDLIKLIGDEKFQI